MPGDKRKGGDVMKSYLWGYIRIFDTEAELHAYMGKNPNHKFVFSVEHPEKPDRKFQILGAGDLSEWQKHPDLYDKGGIKS